MIPVAKQDEPANFESQVRVPGQIFLKSVPRPSSKQYGQARAKYWSLARPDLYSAYRGICSYSAVWVPLKRSSVDHFAPKSKYPSLAYEWDNFRLAQEKVNLYKDNSEDVIDPFIVQPDWFRIDFSTFRIEPGADVDAALENSIRTTIDLLRLNSDPDLVQQRISVLWEYADGRCPLDFLERRYPFIAYELKRQGLVDDIKRMIKKSPKRP